MGKLISISGSDATGKETQVKLLGERLTKMGYNVKIISHPVYNTWGASLVEGYLNGKLNLDKSEMNPYAIASFYANDRYIHMANTHWNDFLNDSDKNIVIADRYVIDNIIYQSLLLDIIDRHNSNMTSTYYGIHTDNIEKYDKLIGWIYHMEYDRFGLPVPDLEIILTMDNTIYDDFKKHQDRSMEDSKHSGTDINENDNNMLRNVHSMVNNLLDNRNHFGFKFHVLNISDSIKNYIITCDILNNPENVLRKINKQSIINTMKQYSIHEINDEITKEIFCHTKEFVRSVEPRNTKLFIDTMITSMRASENISTVEVSNIKLLGDEIC